MTLQDRLSDAEEKYHDLVTGQSVVEVVDQNGEKIRYYPATRNALFAYIADLRRQINNSSVAPMSVWGRG